MFSAAKKAWCLAEFRSHLLVGDLLFYSYLFFNCCGMNSVTNKAWALLPQTSADRKEEMSCHLSV